MFQDRFEAGKQLAERLKPYQRDHPMLFALPRGGVPVGYEIAKAFNSPLEVFVVRKIGVPWNPELGIGAVAPGIQILDEEALHMLGLKESDLKEVIQREQEELKRRLRLYGAEEDLSKIAGRTVILVDDGLATGVTAQVALQGIKQFHPGKLILAVPVGSSQAIAKLMPFVDELICLEVPLDFYAVGAFYQDFAQVSDETVIDLLERANAKEKPEEE